MNLSDAALGPLLLHGWHGPPMSLPQAQRSLDQTRRRRQAGYRQGEHCFEDGETIARYWLGLPIELQYLDARAAAAIPRERALIEIVSLRTKRSRPVPRVNAARLSIRYHSASAVRVIQFLRFKTSFNSSLEYEAPGETLSMSSGNFKHDLFSQFARVGKALSSPNRLELLEFLAQGERSVEALAQVSGLSVANTSQHLQQLRQAGLVASRKEGQHVFYRLAGDEVIRLLEVLRQVAEGRLAEVERLVKSYLTVKDDLEPVPAQELLQRARAGLVTVLDVRPPEEYAAGHLPGAINVPLAELERCIGQCPPDREVVAYCRGPYCVLAYEAVARLREQGFKARRMDQGYPEWKSAGLPVEVRGTE
jgi:rhodanese-related sulfurtransferase/DNA-binding transcriptional ArsR family regulator